MHNTRDARQRANRLALMAADALLINLMYWLSYLVRYELELPYPVPPQYDAPFGPYIPYGLLLMLLCLFAYRLEGLYDLTRRRRATGVLYGLLSGTATSIVMVMAATFLFQPAFYSRGMLVLAGALIVLSLSLARVIYRLILAARRRRAIGVERVLVLGAGEVGRAVMRTLLAEPALGFRVVGYLDDAPEKANGALGRIEGLGPVSNLEQVLRSQPIDQVIVTLPWAQHEKISQAAALCEQHGVEVRVVPDVFQQRIHHIDLETLNGIPLMGAGPAKIGAGNQLIKRVIDLGLCLLALPFFLAVYTIIALLIRLDSPGPVLFKQQRIGKDGRLFEVLKFRTMIEGAEQMQAALSDHNQTGGPTFKMKNDPRCTRVGAWLRRTSLDELPQLINVLRGEMSLVGPRPGTPGEVAQYQPWQMARISVLPGITGLWQVSGRSDIPFDEMVLLDIFYIENWSLDMDLRILLYTIPSVLLSQGAY